MPSKKIKGQDHILAYITPKEADKLVDLGGKETMTKEGIPAYPEFDNYGYSSQQDFDQGNYGRSNDPTVSSYAGGNNLTDQTNVNKKIEEEINKKLNELKPPVIDYTKQKFDNLEKFRTLKKSPIPFAPFRFDGPKNINKTLFDNTISELALSYPDLEITNEFGTVNTDNLKTAIDSAVLKGDLSPIEGLTLTQSITTQGDPSGIGLTYDNNLVNFSTPNINEGDYTLGTNYQIGDLGVGSMFDVKNDSLAKKDLSFDYGDGTLTGSQVTYPGSNFQVNELGLDKNFNVTDNIDVNVKGDLSNVKLDGGTLYTDKSLTPSITYNKNIGDGSLSLSGSKEIIEGGSIPNINFSGSYPLSNNSKIGLTTNNLLSEDRTGNLSYTKNIGNYGDNTFLDASVEVNPFNTDEYTGMLKFNKKFADGGRVGLFMGGDPLTGQALAIYDSMKVYGFDDQAIANALTEQGLYGVDNNTNNQVTTVQDVINQNANPSGSKLEQTLTSPGKLKEQYKAQLNSPINNAIYDFKENMTTKLSDPTTKIGKLGINTKNILGSAIGAVAGIPGLGFVLDALGSDSEFDRGAIRELNAPMQLGIYNKDRTGTGYFTQGPIQPGISSLSDTYKSGLTDGQFAGVTVDDLGRIQQTGDYNTAENVMAGYNAGFDLGATAFDRYDKIDDTIEKEKKKTNVNYAKIKSLQKRQQALTDFALANAAAQRAAKQAAIDRAIARGNKEAEERARVKSITAGYGGHDESPGATGPTAAGAGMGVGGGYASDYGFLKDGGLATMFKEKR